MEDLKTKEDYVKRYDRVFSWSDEDKAYIVRFPELPGCVTHGETISETFRMAEEAAMLYLETLDELKKPYPMPASYSREIKNFQLRLELPLFQLLKIYSEEMGLSINETIVKRLSQIDYFFSKTSPEIEAKKKLMRPEEKLAKAVLGKEPERKKSSKVKSHAPKPKQLSTKKRASY